MDFEMEKSCEKYNTTAVGCDCEEWVYRNKYMDAFCKHQDYIVRNVTTPVYRERANAIWENDTVYSFGESDYESDYESDVEKDHDYWAEVDERIALMNNEEEERARCWIYDSTKKVCSCVDWEYKKSK